MMKIYVELDGKVVELTPEQARTLYSELGKLFATPAVSVLSIWTEPVLKPPYTVTSIASTIPWVPLKQPNTTTPEPNITITC